MEELKLGKRMVGPSHPPYVIAEIGSNHNGDMALCRRLIDAAADAGADAVKFQSWTEFSLIAEEEYERNPEYADKKRHFGSLREMVKAYQLTPDQHAIADAHCRSRDVTFCSTPFSTEEVDLLEKLDVPFFKIASMDINHLSLLRYVAQKQRPMLISTGMATLAEIEAAVGTVRAEGNNRIVLLHCVSIYPPEPTGIHLRNLGTLHSAFDVLVGFSDHTLGTAIPMAAISLGACLIEKHFTLDKEMPGWDHAISADPAELRSIVREGRNVFAALGNTTRTVGAAEMEKRKKFRRSLVATRRLEPGDIVAAEDVAAKRPGTGIRPDQVACVVGREVASAIERDQVIQWQNLR